METQPGDVFESVIESPINVHNSHVESGEVNEG